MPPEAHYYQRLLANDQREASQVLEAHLKSSCAFLSETMPMKLSASC